LVLVGCGDDTPAPFADAATDAAPDAPLDAPPTATLVAADDMGMPATMLVWPSTAVGQMSTATVTLSNAGSAATGPIALSISGATANDYSFDNQLTTCAGVSLAPDASCSVDVIFRPTSAGPRAATLAFTASPGGSGTISLMGSAFMPNLVFVPTTVDFGVLRSASSLTRTVELRNEGTASVPIDNIVTTGTDFARGLSSCGATLAAGASCDITVSVTSDALGALSGTLEVTSDGGTYAAPIIATRVRSITVTRIGTGTGTITSNPVGIDCGSSCTHEFSTSNVTLTATADAGSELVGWTVAACGSEATCAVPAGTGPANVAANFAATGDASIHLTFAGTGVGEVRVQTPSTSVSCFSTCTVPAQAGDQISIVASTASTFSGFSGACTGPSCTFTAPTGTANVTATFSKDAKEGWTRFLDGPIHTAAYDREGNLIVGSATSLTKLSPTGTTLWSISFAAAVLDTGPDNAIYAVGSLGSGPRQLHKFDASGTAMWSTALPAVIGDGSLSGEGYPRWLTVGSAGQVAVQRSDGFGVWEASGAQRWARAGTFLMVHGIGIDAAGDIVVADRDLSVEGKRFAAADGSPLGSLGIIADGYVGGLDTDLGGRLVASYSGSSTVGVSWATGGFGEQYGVGASYANNGAVSSPTGDVLAAYTFDSDAGWRAQRRTSTGTQTWVLTRLRSGDYGTVVQNLASSDNGQLALVGMYWGVNGSPVGWVQVFSP
jgi:hypothetical protein